MRTKRERNRNKQEHHQPLISKPNKINDLHKGGLHCFLNMFLLIIARANSQAITTRKNMLTITTVFR